MSDVLFIGGPLNGVTQATNAQAVNVIDDSRPVALRLVTYRVDPVAGTARVIAESDI